MTSFKLFLQKLILLGTVPWDICLLGSKDQLSLCPFGVGFWFICELRLPLITILRSAVSTGEVMQQKASNGHVSHLEEAVSDLEVI